LECCCFVNNEELLSGSDDGSIELWTVMRKKPVYILKNAHALLVDSMKSEQKDSERLPNGNLGKVLCLFKFPFKTNVSILTVPSTV